MGDVMENTMDYEEEISVNSMTMNRSKITTHERTKSALLERAKTKEEEFKERREEFHREMEIDIKATPRVPESQKDLAKKFYKSFLDAQEKILKDIKDVIRNNLDKNYPIPSFLIRHFEMSTGFPTGYKKMGNGNDHIQTTVKVQFCAMLKEELLEDAQRNLAAMSGLMENYRSTMEKDIQSLENATDFHKKIAVMFHEVFLTEMKKHLESCIELAKKELSSDYQAPSFTVRHLISASSFPISYTRLRNSNQLF